MGRVARGSSKGSVCAVQEYLGFGHKVDPELGHERTINSQIAQSCTGLHACFV